MALPCHPDDAVPDLTVLLPEGSPASPVVPEDVRRRFGTCWRALRDQGFDIEVRRNSVRVRHAGQGFERVIQLSGEDDLGEKRELFRALRSAFGGLVERWLPHVVQPSPTVTWPYLNLKQVIEICQGVRALRRRSAAVGAKGFRPRNGAAPSVPAPW
ncbi:MAG: hypothetical protein ACNA8S_05010 [Deferrisomatales bacterium]